MTSIRHRLTRAATVMALAMAMACGLMVPSGCSSSAKTGSTSQSAADWQQQQLLQAAQGGHRDRVTKLLDQGADVNGKDPTTGRTALHLAAANGHKELTAYLLDRGAEVNAQDSAGNTPLHLAAIGGHKKTVTALLQAPASRTIRNKDGQTPAEVANPGVLPLIEAGTKQ